MASFYSILWRNAAASQWLFRRGSGWLKLAYCDGHPSWYWLAILPPAGGVCLAWLAASMTWLVAAGRPKAAMAVLAPAAAYSVYDWLRLGYSTMIVNETCLFVWLKHYFIYSAHWPEVIWYSVICQWYQYSDDDNLILILMKADDTVMKYYSVLWLHYSDSTIVVAHLLTVPYWQMARNRLAVIPAYWNALIYSASQWRRGSMWLT